MVVVVVVRVLLGVVLVVVVVVERASGRALEGTCPLLQAGLARQGLLVIQVFLRLQVILGRPEDLVGLVLRVLLILQVVRGFLAVRRVQMVLSGRVHCSWLFRMLQGFRAGRVHRAVLGRQVLLEGLGAQLVLVHHLILAALNRRAVLAGLELLGHRAVLELRQGISGILSMLEGKAEQENLALRVFRAVRHLLGFLADRGFRAGLGDPLDS